MKLETPHSKLTELVKRILLSTYEYIDNQWWDTIVEGQGPTNNKQALVYQIYEIAHLFVEYDQAVMDVEEK